MTISEIFQLNQWLAETAADAQTRPPFQHGGVDFPFVRRMFELLAAPGATPTSPFTIKRLKELLEPSRAGDPEALDTLREFARARTYKRNAHKISTEPIQPLTGNAALLVALAAGGFLPDDLEIAGEPFRNLRRTVLTAAAFHACGSESAAADLERLFVILNK